MYKKKYSLHKYDSKVTDKFWFDLATKNLGQTYRNDILLFENNLEKEFLVFSIQTDLKYLTDVTSYTDYTVRLNVVSNHFTN